MLPEYSAEPDWQSCEWPYFEAAASCPQAGSEQRSALLPAIRPRAGLPAIGSPPSIPGFPVRTAPTEDVRTAPTEDSGVCEECEECYEELDASREPHPVLPPLHKKLPAIRGHVFWGCCVFFLGIALALGVVGNRLLAEQHHTDTVLLTESPQSVRENIISRLDGSALIELLGSHSLTTKLGRALLKEASSRKDERISQTLGSLTDSSRMEVRIAAMNALSSEFHMARPATIRAILDRLQWDRESIVRAYAARILVRSGNQDAIATLRERLNKENSSLVVAIAAREFSAVERQERTATAQE